MEKRLENEITHGRFLAATGAGEIWNWETPAGRKRWQRRVGMLTAGIRPEMCVLELGCGTGYFTKELGRTGGKITAIDISPDLVAIARHEMPGNGIEFKIENAYEMGFSSLSFDMIVGSSVLHHLEIDKALDECYRVLKPSGTIYFTEPNMLNPQIAMQKNIPWLKKKLGDSPDETAFFRWEMEKILKKHRFVDVKVVPFDWLHPATPAHLLGLVGTLGKLLESIPLIKEFAGSLYITCRKPMEKA